VIWHRNYVDADATGETELGQVRRLLRRLLLDSDPYRLPRNPARSWYHLSGTIYNSSLKEQGRP
jgi:hypothetical protein